MRARKTVMRAARRLRRAWDSHLRQITLAEGIPDSYRTVLLFLHRHPGSGQRNIAEFANVTTSAINQAVKSMVEEGRDCSEVLVQLAAVRSALDNTGKVILKDHMRHCVVDAVSAGDQASIDDLCMAIDKFMK